MVEERKPILGQRNRFLAEDIFPGESYHDWYFIGAKVKQGEAVLFIDHPYEDIAVEVVLRGVSRFWLDDMCQGNIVMEVTMDIISPDNLDLVSKLLRWGEKTYPERARWTEEATAQFIGRKLVSVSATFGATAIAICDSASERRGKREQKFAELSTAQKGWA
jgi:hypothetical protein